jgi:DNA-binding NtrC family response regulator
VRKLSNLRERVVLFCPGDTIESAHFPTDVQGLSKSAASDAQPAPAASAANALSQINGVFPLGESLSDLQDQIINEVLRRAAGNKSLASKHLSTTGRLLDRRRKP